MRKNIKNLRKNAGFFIENALVTCHETDFIIGLYLLHIPHQKGE